MTEILSFEEKFVVTRKLIVGTAFILIRIKALYVTWNLKMQLSYLNVSLERLISLDSEILSFHDFSAEF